MSLVEWNKDYRAPEMGEEYSDGKAIYGQHADWFSFGLILSEIFDPAKETELPWKFGEIIHGRKTGSVIKNISWLNSLILRLTEREPTKRIEVGDGTKNIQLKLRESQTDYEQHKKINSIHLMAFDEYKKYIESNSNGFLSEEDVEVVHKKALNEGLCYLLEEIQKQSLSSNAKENIQKQFDAMAENQYQKFRVQAATKLKNMEDTVKQQANFVKSNYIQSVNNLFSENTISETEIDFQHNQLKNDSMSRFFDLLPKEYEQLSLQSHISHLENDIDTIFAEHKTSWELKKERQISKLSLTRSNAVKEYHTKMMTYKQGVKSFLTLDQLKEYHGVILEQVVEEHEKNFDSTAAFQSFLADDINQIFLELERENNEKKIEAVKQFENELRTTVHFYTQELEIIAKEMKETQDFCRKKGQVEDKIRNQMLLQFKNLPDCIIQEFIEIMNSAFRKHSSIAIEKFEQHQKELKDAKPLVNVTDILSPSTGSTEEQIVQLYSDFTLKHELDANHFNDYLFGTSFQVDEYEGDPPIYLKGVGFAGSPSKVSERTTMKIKVSQGEGFLLVGQPLCEMETIYIAEAGKVEIIDLSEPVPIFPKKKYFVCIWPTAGGVASWKNGITDHFLYSEAGGHAKRFKLTAITAWGYVYTLKFSLFK